MKPISQPVVKKKNATPAPPIVVSLNWKYTLVAGLILLVITGAVWSTPRATGDLWIALAGGRDLLSGQLNTPDTWSFTTNGRSWINQNWGSDLILFLIYKLGGTFGLLALKLLLISFTGFFLVLLMLKRKVPLVVGLLVTAGLMITLNSYLNLRPNLLTIILTPLTLLLLFSTEERPGRIWGLVPLMILWANVHGGFIFGLGMMSLWTIALMASKLIREGWKALKPNWHFIAGTMAAILLAAVINPFGVINLTFPFKMMNGGVWNTVIDWKPIWVAGTSGFAGVRDFLIIIGITFLLLVVNWFISRSRAKLKRASAPESSWRRNNFNELIFDTTLTGISLVMAITSIRFIPIALLVLAPILAGEVWRLMHSLGWRWTLAGVSLLVLGGGWLIASNNWRSYAFDNPFSPTGQGVFFEKMHCLNSAYPVELAGFIKDNGIGGNVFNSWEWEGFLRWNVPQMKVFIGGRAQQVYREETFKEYMALYYNDENIFAGKSGAVILKSTKAHLILVPNTRDFEQIIKTALDIGSWAIVYADRQSLLLADLHWTDTRKIAAAAINHSLIFKNPATGAMSQAAYCLSRPGEFKKSETISKFARAFELQPDWSWGYQNLFNHYLDNSTLQEKEQIAAVLEKARVGLGNMKTDDSNAGTVLSCLFNVSKVLYLLDTELKKEGEASAAYETYIDADALYTELQKKWGAI